MFKNGPPNYLNMHPFLLKQGVANGYSVWLPMSLWGPPTPKGQGGGGLKRELNNYLII